MQFVKKNMVMLLCGTMSLVAIAVLVMGMMNTSVKDEMQKRINAAGQISSLRSSPKNERVIQAEAARVKAIETDLKKSTDLLDKRNAREPLMKEVFPKTTSGAKAIEFKLAYREALQKGLRELGAGDLPTPAEIEEEQQNVNDLIENERASQDGGEAPPPPVAAASGMTGRTAPAVGIAGAPRIAGAAVPAQPPAGVNAADIKYNAERRAQIAKSKLIRIYANEGALHYSPIIDQQTAPNVNDMWLAQVGLWIQQDVMKAIHDLNQDAARNVDDPNVEISPVKRLERMRVFGYIGPDGKLIEFPVTGGGPGGAGMVQAPGVHEMRPSFTGRKADERFDVVRFMMVVVVDQRDLLALIDRISKQNMYQCTHLEYGSAESVLGYVYGPDPVVRATLEFECYLSRKAYKTIMPPDVLKQLGGNPEGANP